MLDNGGALRPNPNPRNKNVVDRGLRPLPIVSSSSDLAPTTTTSRAPTTSNAKPSLKTRASFNNFPTAMNLGSMPMLSSLSSSSSRQFTTSNKTSSIPILYEKNDDMNDRNDIDKTGEIEAVDLDGNGTTDAIVLNEDDLEEFSALANDRNFYNSSVWFTIRSIMIVMLLSFLGLITTRALSGQTGCTSSHPDINACESAIMPIIIEKWSFWLCGLAVITWCVSYLQSQPLSPIILRIVAIFFLFYSWSISNPSIYVIATYNHISYTKYLGRHFIYPFVILFAIVYGTWSM
jgi:hypothetical protein